MAIGLGSSLDGGNNGASTNSWTFAFNNVAGNILFVGVEGDGGGLADDVTGVTYNGVAMTLIGKINDGNLPHIIYLFHLESPATGSNNVIISATTSHHISGCAISYTGAAQSGQPDNSTTNISTTSATTLTTSLTTVADNCWTVLYEHGYNNGSNPTAGTGSTQRVVDGTSGNAEFSLNDSNAAIHPAASYSMSTGRTPSVGWAIGHIMASFKPLVAVPKMPAPALQAVNRAAVF